MFLFGLKNFKNSVMFIFLDFITLSAKQKQKRIMKIKMIY